MGLVPPLILSQNKTSQRMALQMSLDLYFQNSLVYCCTFTRHIFCSNPAAGKVSTNFLFARSESLFIPPSSQPCFSPSIQKI
jgi:hypothetical protein